MRKLILQEFVSASGTVLATSDIRFRFNNWDRVRAQRIPVLLVYAAACGFTALIFLLLVTGRLAYRGEKEAVAV
jgi:predicted xylose isomerase-like sugar epimerase